MTEGLSDFARLRDVQLRKSLEAEHGLFIAEGEKVIRRAVGAGYPVRSVLLARRWLEPLADLLDTIDAPVHVLDDSEIEEITGFEVHRGALASMDRLPLPSVGDLLGPAPSASGEPTAGRTGLVCTRRILVLEDLVDHGNVGSIFRCAAALGVDAVILSPRCADPLYRRAVKVSMGAVFAVPYARMTDWHAGLGELRAAGFRTLALTPDQRAVPIGDVEMGERTALLLGSEGDGLSSRWLAEADLPVCIPMSAVAMERGVDSLNVVAAAAIACHSLVTR
ncbi:TrmH family RNA methyltransferase [Rhizohabitans arisaemae]|uniref:TrmH family RNA methyltransferase n=1 Tax=Rhizohabitans arisaemae TaxID=2720610 RepID=UPI0024B16ED8|nr:RNA methyltransferase [Rhizohabitans arisaemae]